MPLTIHRAFRLDLIPMLPRKAVDALVHEIQYILILHRERKGRRVAVLLARDAELARADVHVVAPAGGAAREVDAPVAGVREDAAAGVLAVARRGRRRVRLVRVGQRRAEPRDRLVACAETVLRLLVERGRDGLA